MVSNKDLSLSCQTNKSPDKNDLKNRCSEIQKKSDSKTDCEWCSDIDKYIKSQTPEPSPSPTPTPTDTPRNITIDPKPINFSFDIESAETIKKP